MPAKSRAQQRFMGLVRAVQKGEAKAPSREVAAAAASMSEEDAQAFASTSHRGLPERKKRREEKKAAARVASAYASGFIATCAGRGVDSVELLRSVEEGMRYGYAV